jgi:type II restriction enzyme
MSIDSRIEHIIKRLPKLTKFQVESIDNIIAQLQRPKKFWRNPASDLISDAVLEDFGDALRIHHVFSAEALSKDRFEYALERVLNGCGIPAKRAPRGNPGHDITIRGIPCSLKTQADKNIRINTIHISKYMELGKGEWTDKISDLDGLRERFFEHLKRYERIFTLRRLRDSDEHYELVEIPKPLLEKARTGVLRIDDRSRQNPKPGCCTVKGQDSGIEFELYFDGGTERKLQVRKLRKDLCTVHATWRFPRHVTDEEPAFENGENSD